MPFENAGGTTYSNQPLGANFGAPIYGTPDPVVIPPTSGGGGAASGAAETEAAVPQSLSELAAAASSATILHTPPPTASAPFGGFPANPRRGGFYIFATAPTTIYVYCPDNVWRGILLVPV